MQFNHFCPLDKSNILNNATSLLYILKIKTPCSGGTHKPSVHKHLHFLTSSSAAALTLLLSPIVSHIAVVSAIPHIVCIAGILMPCRCRRPPQHYLSLLLLCIYVSSFLFFSPILQINKKLEEQNNERGEKRRGVVRPLEWLCNSTAIANPILFTILQFVHLFRSCFAVVTAHADEASPAAVTGLTVTFFLSKN